MNTKGFWADEVAAFKEIVDEDLAAVSYTSPDSVIRSLKQQIHKERCERALDLLREVHRNGLDGFLYSGELRERIADFLKCRDLCSKGDGMGYQGD